MINKPVPELHDLFHVAINYKDYTPAIGLCTLMFYKITQYKFTISYTIKNVFLTCQHTKF
jgi:hypothetical protein